MTWSEAKRKPLSSPFTKPLLSEMWVQTEEALLKSSRQKNFDVMGGLVWKQFRYTPKSPKILGLWLADPTGGKRKQ